MGVHAVEELNDLGVATRAANWRVAHVSQERLREVAGSIHAPWRGRYIATLIALDLLVGVGSSLAAAGLRFRSPTGGRYDGWYLWVTLALPLAWVAALTLNRAYEARHLFVGTDEYERVFRSALGLTAAVAIVSFAFDLRLARGYVIIALPLAAGAGIATRYVVRQRLHRSWARGERLSRVILVGHEPAVADMAHRLRRERYHGLGVVGACLPTWSGTSSASGDPRLPSIYGTFDDVAHAVARARADTVIVLSCPEIDGPALRRLAWRLERDEIDLVVASTLVDVTGDRTTIRPVDGLPLLHVEHPRLRGSRLVLKGLLDRAGAAVLLVLFAPVLLALAAMVRFSSDGPGPAVFRQFRVGRYGAPFTIYKFRTMYVDAEQRMAELRHMNDTGGTLFKMRTDPRVTPIGRWLRRLSLDELPQLLNVVKGDMSLVGPRPPLASEVASYPADMRRRLVVKPGLTGLWQVSGRSDLSWEETIRLDLHYVENWSLSMDLTILARTLVAVARRSGAY